MYIIGERINGMFKDVRQAIKNKDKKIIQDLALKQLSKGASALDVNVGPAASDKKEAMEWLVETITEVTSATLSIDSPNPEVIEAGLSKCKSNSIINSTTADDEKLDRIIPLAKKYNAMLVGLTMDKNGVPQDASSRIELAVKIITKAQEYEFGIEELFIDNVILPVYVAQAQCPQVLEAIKEIKLLSEPSPKTILGLSNVSQGTKKRSLINRIYLVMAAGYGLDAAILDPFDNKLLDSLTTAELLLNKYVYCESFLEAYRK
jgi:5-methyltetrahydrofolate corrinoid/iron sulfur protein methyltransferase